MFPSKKENYSKMLSSLNAK